MFRRLILTVGMCLITTLSFAEVTAEIVSKDLDDNGNIRIWVTYKIDGMEVPSRYPKIDNKSVYCTRYDVRNFIGMNKTQIVSRIKQDLTAQAKNLIQQTFIKKKNALMDFNGIVGKNITETNTTFPINETKQWRVYSDGNYSEENLTP